MALEKEIPEWIGAARLKWKYKGKERPPFAIEPKEGQVSVWDFPRPPEVVEVKELVQVFSAGKLIVKSKNALAVRETANPPTIYIPPQDVNRTLLTELVRESWCEWKGKASYWSLTVAPEIPVAWSYEHPFDPYSRLANYYAFYPHGLECYIGDIEVKAQKSSFYAGWITPDLVGPFKGDPGSEEW